MRVPENIVENRNLIGLSFGGDKTEPIVVQEEPTYVVDDNKGKRRNRGT